jgi:hypothetical protein
LDRWPSAGFTSGVVEFTCNLWMHDGEQGQSEPASTSAPTWMDGALIGFSFLSLCHHPRLTFFFALSQPWSALISVFSCNFIFSRPRTQFFFFWVLKLFPPTHLQPASDLLTYIFELKVDSSPSTYSPINLKCDTLIYHGPTYQTPPTWLPCNRPSTVDNNEERINCRYCMELVLVYSNKINKGMINVFNTPHVMVLPILLRKCFPWGYCKPSG